jgi:hypothetical protein
MNETTATSHLLAKRDAELPAAMTGFAPVQKVVVLVTVDRQGTICDLKPVAGPTRLRRRAVMVVKKYWCYRPFLVNWKPVVAQFPVTVRFVPPTRQEPHWIITWDPGSSGLFARFLQRVTGATATAEDVTIMPRRQ